ncbi:MAG: metallophosphoesterase [Acidiferrobacteraceae bacterium]
MRIQCFSDLHLETREDANLARIADDVDVVVLAGDIHQGTHGITWAKTLGCPVVYVLGNHEFYGRDYDAVLAEAQRRSSGTAVHVLDRSVWIHHGVRFLGATLWSDFSLNGDPERAMAEAQSGIPDYDVITYRKRRLQPEDTRAFHEQDRAWLHQRLSEPHDGPTVVVTHMPPAPQCLNQNFADEDRLNPYFASDCAELLDGRADLWFCGHTHQAIDVVIGKTRLVSNPAGYDYEVVDGFDRSLAIDIVRRAGARP